MRKIFTADSETEPFLYERIPYPFIWGLYEKDIFTTFWGKDATKNFIEYITKIDCIVFAHNAGKFDWHYILPYIKDDTPVLLINGRIAAFKIGKAEFRDSFTILPIPLADYKKDKIDYSIFEPTERNKKHNKEKIIDYLRGDCIYLYDLVSKFIERFGYHITLATAAMHQWRKISGLKSPVTCQGFYDTIKPYYYGGRCECFRTGIIEEKFTVLDINSLYPFAMQHKHPFGNVIEFNNRLSKNPDKIARSFINLETTSTGLFPHREKIGLEFPNDEQTREFFITGWEYLTAKKLNLLKEHKIIKVLSIPKKPVSFKKYVEHFYEEKLNAKKENRKADYLFAKLMLNSLYGKFGANPVNYREYKIVKNLAGFPDWQESSILYDMFLIEKELPEYKQHYHCVATAASITGFARSILLQALFTVNTPLYCDTDSIACIDHNLPVSDKIGDWKIENVCNFGAIAGKKLYAFQDAKTGKYKTASKGVRLSPQQIIKIAKGETYEFQPAVPTYSIFSGIHFTERLIKKTKNL